MKIDHIAYKNYICSKKIFSDFSDDIFLFVIRNQSSFSSFKVRDHLTFNGEKVDTSNFGAKHCVWFTK